ncbi:hypothetical protein G9A89_006972 [Geosiphon pyriformis]|nr:hypothetical protein G9A89_006972 [Geosiphon pyriformis]
MKKLKIQKPRIFFSFSKSLWPNIFYDLRHQGSKRSHGQSSANCKHPGLAKLSGVNSAFMLPAFSIVFSHTKRSGRNLQLFSTLVVKASKVHGENFLLSHKLRNVGKLFIIQRIVKSNASRSYASALSGARLRALRKSENDATAAKNSGQRGKSGLNRGIPRQNKKAVSFSDSNVKASYDQETSDDEEIGLDDDITAGVVEFETDSDEESNENSYSYLSSDEESDTEEENQEKLTERMREFESQAHEVEEIDPEQYPQLYPNQQASPSDESFHENEEHENWDTAHQYDTNSDSNANGYSRVDHKKYQKEILSQHDDANDSWFVDSEYEIPQGENAEERVSDEYIPLWQRKAASISGREPPSKFNEVIPGLDRNNPSGSKALEIIGFLEEEGAANMKVLDLRNKCDWTDWMIVAEAKGARHLLGICDGVYKGLKNKLKQAALDRNPVDSTVDNYPIIEGRDSEDWMLIDTGPVMVHIFTSEARAYYNLESLWARVPASGNVETPGGVRLLTQTIKEGFARYDPKWKKEPPELEEIFY